MNTPLPTLDGVGERFFVGGWSSAGTVLRWPCSIRRLGAPVAARGADSGENDPGRPRRCDGSVREPREHPDHLIRQGQAGPRRFLRHVAPASRHLQGGARFARDAGRPWIGAVRVDTGPRIDGVLDDRRGNARVAPTTSSRSNRSREVNRRKRRNCSSVTTRTTSTSACAARSRSIRHHHDATRTRRSTRSRRPDRDRARHVSRPTLRVLLPGQRRRGSGRRLDLPQRLREGVGRHLSCAGRTGWRRLVGGVRDPVQDRRVPLCRIDVGDSTSSATSAAATRSFAGRSASESIPVRPVDRGRHPRAGRDGPGHGCRRPPVRRGKTVRDRVSGRRYTTLSPGFDGFVRVSRSTTARADDQHRLRRHRSRRAPDQSHALPAVLPREARFLPAGHEHLRFGANGDVIPFFTRRIGLAPSGREVPIDVGLKVTGREGR